MQDPASIIEALRAHIDRHASPLANTTVEPLGYFAKVCSRRTPVVVAATVATGFSFNMLYTIQGSEPDESYGVVLQPFFMERDTVVNRAAAKVCVFPCSRPNRPPLSSAIIDNRLEVNMLYINMLITSRFAP